VVDVILVIAFFTSMSHVIVSFNATSQISHGGSGNIWRFVFSANAANYSALFKIYENNK
jgi:hypothetical protein